MPRHYKKLNLLTPSEVQVTQRITLGWTNEQIANERKVSKRTIEKTRADIYSKLGICNLAQLVHHAVLKGWIHIGDEGVGYYNDIAHFWEGVENKANIVKNAT